MSVQSEAELNGEFISCRCEEKYVTVLLMTMCLLFLHPRSWEESRDIPTRHNGHHVLCFLCCRCHLSTWCIGHHSQHVVDTKTVLTGGAPRVQSYAMLTAAAAALPYFSTNSWCSCVCRSSSSSRVGLSLSTCLSCIVSRCAHEQQSTTLQINGTPPRPPQRLSPGPTTSQALTRTNAISKESEGR